jgi:hypothetical protein
VEKTIFSPFGETWGKQSGVFTLLVIRVTLEILSDFSAVPKVAMYLKVIINSCCCPSLSVKTGITRRLSIIISRPPIEL